MIFVALALAQDESLWISRNGVEGFDWGTSSVPFDAVPRARDLVLPDSDFIGASKQDRPEDVEVKAPQGERRFLRYAQGVLVDAWLMAERRLDPTLLVSFDKPDWTGVILGPADDGYFAYGVASSWTYSDRTVLYWSDREGKRDILVSRAVPSPQYGIGRPEPLKRPGDTGGTAKLSGDLKKAAKPFRGSLAGCFDQSPKPVEAKILMKLDPRGIPSRIRITADQPATSVEDCVAAAMMDVRGSPNSVASLTMLRFR